jgi:chromate transporter
VNDSGSTTLKYLFLTFLKIGATSWGGFMALISVVQKRVVERDKRIEGESLLEGISLASVLPGPMAFNVVTFIGYKLRGMKGALVSMAGILLPSFMMMILLSFLYIKYGDIPSFTHFFSGVLPAVAAIIISVAIAMAKKNISDVPQIIIAVAAAVIIVLSRSYITTLIVMLVSGITGYLIYRKQSVEKDKEVMAKHINLPGGRFVPLLSALIVVSVVLILILPLILPQKFEPSAILHQKIMLAFSGMSLSLFGGGYVVIPAMQQVIVNSMNWLTDKEFADAVAMGQITPGPIFISSAFIGYKLAGFWGALNATISIFLPPGLVMIACTHYFDKIRNSIAITAVFKGLRPAIIGMIAATAFTILSHGEISLKTVLLFFVFLILAIRYKADPVFLIPGAGIIGLILF